MKKFKLFLFALLACIILPSSISALEEKTCKVIASDNEKVDATEVDEFVKYLEETVYNLNNGSGILGSEKFTYEIHVDKDTVTDEVFEEAVKVNQDFNSENEAMEYYNNIVLETPYVKKNYKISPFAKPFVSYTKGEPIVCTDLSCVKEMEDLYNKLMANQRLEYMINIEEVPGSEEFKQPYQENGETVYFDSEAEAKAQADNYKPTLDGYKFVKNTVESKYFEAVTKTYNDTFDTLDEAEAALNKFKAENNVTSSSIQATRDSNEDVSESKSKEFNTKAEAEKWISDNAYNDEKGKLEITSDIQEETIKEDESKISEVFASEDLANEYIQKLEDAGYTVESELNEVKQGITGEVIKGTSYPKAGRFEFSMNDTNFLLLKQGSGHYAVWTESALTPEEKANFVSTYNQVNSGDSKFDGSTQGISIDDISWLVGFDTFDLSNMQSWGKYTISKEGNNIVLTCDANQISHVIQGLAKDKVTYVLSGTKYKEKKVYKVNYTEVTYGYDYVLSATAEVAEATTKYYINSSFVNLVKKATLNYNIVTFDTKTVYNLSYDKYSVHNREIAYINWAILSCENVETGNDDVLTDKVVTVSKNDYPNPPQTGVETNSSIMSYVLVGMALYVSYKTYKLVKNN